MDNLEILDTSKRIEIWQSVLVIQQILTGKSCLQTTQNNDILNVLKKENLWMIISIWNQSHKLFSSKSLGIWTR